MHSIFENKDRQAGQVDAFALVSAVTQMHQATVTRWHDEPINNPYAATPQPTAESPWQGLLAVTCQQHQFNFLLWHEEDIARSPHVGDERIAQVKRAIDGYNQQRNDWIERIDEFLLAELERGGIQTTADAPLNTETPGSAFDRLSIMSLRIFHVREQLAREDIDEELRRNVQLKLERCLLQHADLSTELLAELLADIAAGRKQLKLYRQMKMYNDPRLNPYLYQGAAAVK